jgi:histidinol-phosphate aminotransferase
MNRIIGLIVNPVAGMGGSVGLKGTDGEMHKRALELGARPVTPKRTDEVLSHIKKKDRMTLVVAPGKMGERHASACDIHDHPNLAITRTMDKAFSLAGARIGYMIAGEAFINAFSSFYTLLPRVGSFAASAALQNPDYMSRNVSRVIAERKRVWNTLKKLAIQVYPSATNFLLAKTDIPDLVRKLDDVGIQILDLSNQLAPGYIRVSIGTRDENDAFIKSYMKIRETYSGAF